jgi:phospholipid/cholesterol/gamma-HCH transport system substrate-binding protein
MKRRDEVLVGVFIIVAVAIGLLGTLWLVRGGLSSGYPLYVKFAWGQNLKPGQPVLLAGVNVGGVRDVKLRDDGYLDVILRVNDDVKVPKNSFASVKPIGIFGDAAVALTPKGPSRVSYAPNDTVPVGPSDTDIQAIMNRVDSIGATVQLMTKTLNQELIASGGFKDMRKTLANAAELSANASRLSVQLNAIAAEQNRNLTATMASFRRAASAVDSAQIDAEELPHVEREPHAHRQQPGLDDEEGEQPGRRDRARRRHGGEVHEGHAAVPRSSRAGDAGGLCARRFEGEPEEIHQPASLLGRTVRLSDPYVRPSGSKRESRRG